MDNPCVGTCILHGSSEFITLTTTVTGSFATEYPTTTSYTSPSTSGANSIDESDTSQYATNSMESTTSASAPLQSPTSEGSPPVQSISTPSLFISALDDPRVVAGLVVGIIVLTVCVAFVCRLWRRRSRRRRSTQAPESASKADLVPPSTSPALRTWPTTTYPPRIHWNPPRHWSLLRPQTPSSLAPSSSENLSSDINHIQREMSYMQRITSSRNSMAASKSSLGTLKPRPGSAVWTAYWELINRSRRAEYRDAEAGDPR
ncbi:hypothetical protein B0H10DRAFT_723723 [Mycena sp. CBHHK59/15]|nr:hypothetical protein B0H10DRAFT_723723 [Mycena sp. CBHHK59/15]